MSIINLDKQKPTAKDFAVLSILLKNIDDKCIIANNKEKFMSFYLLRDKILPYYLNGIEIKIKNYSKFKEDCTTYFKNMFENHKDMIKMVLISLDRISSLKDPTNILLDIVRDNDDAIIKLKGMYYQPAENVSTSIKFDDAISIAIDVIFASSYDSSKDSSDEDSSDEDSSNDSYSGYDSPIYVTIGFKDKLPLISKEEIKEEQARKLEEIQNRARDLWEKKQREINMKKKDECNIL
jgi:hypothetical protein